MAQLKHHLRNTMVKDLGTGKHTTELLKRIHKGNRQYKRHRVFTGKGSHWGCQELHVLLSGTPREDTPNRQTTLSWEQNQNTLGSLKALLFKREELDSWYNFRPKNSTKYVFTIQIVRSDSLKLGSANGHRYDGKNSGKWVISTAFRSRKNTYFFEASV